MNRYPWIVWALLVPPWAIFLLACYWYFLDTQPPLVIEYSHPLFTSAPAKDRADAKAKEITEALGGSSVFTYREFCRLRALPGTMVTRWDAAGFSWTVPAEPFPAMPRLAAWRPVMKLRCRPATRRARCATSANATIGSTRCRVSSLQRRRFR